MNQNKHDLGAMSIAFVQAIAAIDNEAIQRIGVFLGTQPLAFRSCFIERCSRLIGAAASVEVDSD